MCSYTPCKFKNHLPREGGDSLLWVTACPHIRDLVLPSVKWDSSCQGLYLPLTLPGLGNTCLPELCQAPALSKSPAYQEELEGSWGRSFFSPRGGFYVVMMCGVCCYNARGATGRADRPRDPLGFRGHQVNNVCSWQMTTWTSLPPGSTWLSPRSLVCV